MNTDMVTDIDIDTDTDTNTIIIDGNTMYITEKFDGLFQQWIMKNIEILIFDTRAVFNKPIVLTPRVICVIFGALFNQPLVLTHNIQYLDLGSNFNQTISLTHKMIVLRMSVHFNKPIILTPKIRALVFYSFDQPIVLTKKIRAIFFGHCFNKPIVLPKHITYLMIGNPFNQPIILTKNIKYLVTTCRCPLTQSLVLTENVEYFQVLNNNNHILEHLPNGLKKFSFINSFWNGLNNLPNKLTSIKGPGWDSKPTEFWADDAIIPDDKLGFYLYQYILHKYRF